MPEKEIFKDYLVEIDVLIPAILKYKVRARTVEEALEQYHKQPLLEQPRYRINKAKKLKAKVIEWATSKIVMIRQL